MVPRRISSPPSVWLQSTSPHVVCGEETHLFWEWRIRVFRNKSAPRMVYRGVRHFWVLPRKGHSRSPTVMRDVRPGIYTASRKIPMDSLRTTRAAVNRIPRFPQYAEREKRTITIAHCAPEPTLMWATCGANLRTFGLVEKRLVDHYNYSDSAPLPTNRYRSWIFHTAPNSMMQRVAPSVHRGVRR